MQENLTQDHENDLIIVGSGRSLQGSKLGRTIDSFGRVFRFKGYENGIGHYDDDVGTKCTDMFVNGNIHAMRDLVQKVASGNLPRDIRTVHYGYDKLLMLDDFLALQALLPPHNIELSYIPCREYLPKLKKRLAWWNVPSSGLSVIYHFVGIQDVHAHYNIDHTSRTFIAGFDAVVSRNPALVKEKRLVHYYSLTEVEMKSKPKRWILKHNLKAESKLLKQWLAEGKTHLLQSSVKHE